MQVGDLQFGLLQRPCRREPPLPPCTVFETPVFAPIIVSSPISICPVTPTCPARITRLPIWTLPAIRTARRSRCPRRRSRCARSARGCRSSPRARSTFGRTRAIDRGVRADLDVVVDLHDANLRHLLPRAPGPGLEAEAVRADYDAAVKEARARRFCSARGWSRSGKSW